MSAAAAQHHVPQHDVPTPGGEPHQTPQQTYADAASRLQMLGGQVIAITGSAADLAAAEAQGQAEGLAFRDGDVIQVGYRADPRRDFPETRSVHYGPTGREIAQAVSRTLDRPAESLRAEPAGDPQPFDLTWIVCDATGRRLARVRGFSSVWMNLALGRRDLAGRIAPSGRGPAPATPYVPAPHERPHNTTPPEALDSAAYLRAAAAFAAAGETFLEPAQDDGPETGDDA